MFLFTLPPASSGERVKRSVVKFKVDVCKDMSVVDETGEDEDGFGGTSSPCRKRLYVM